MSTKIRQLIFVILFSFLFSLCKKVEKIEIEDFSVGSGHVCAVKKGNLYCWGANNDGQIKEGGNFYFSPVKIELPEEVLQVSAGGEIQIPPNPPSGHTCALTKSGSLYCWGNNVYGQIGESERWKGMEKPLMDGIKYVSAGGRGTCAITQDNKLICLGIKEVDIKEVDIKPIKVHVGGRHVCAIDGNYKLFCYGDNNKGQLGIGQTSPVGSGYVGVDEDIIDFCAGERHTCALTKGGNVFCFGDNSFNQIGVKESVVVSPQRINVEKSNKITCGSNHTCVLTEKGEVYCWGWGFAGQKGDYLQSIAKVELGERVIDVRAGGLTTCALTGKGRLLCWGFNAFGQLGIGEQSAIYKPQKLPEKVKYIKTGIYNTIYINEKDEIKCFGNSVLNQCSRYYGVITEPVRIGNFDGIDKISCSFHCCALISGYIYCWGAVPNEDGTWNLIPYIKLEPYIEEKKFKDVEVGMFNTCALDENLHPQCFGLDIFGEEKSEFRNTKALRISMGGSFDSVNICVITEGGKVKCWGNIRYDTPDVVGVKDLCVGGYHACAIVEGGIKCWGKNNYYQLGNGDKSRKLVDINGNFRKVSCGLSHTCAIDDEGEIICWGNNIVGQMGEAPINKISSLPKKIKFDEKVYDVSTSFLHTCVILISGDAYCWGYDQYSQSLGGKDYSIPQEVKIKQ